jgi:serine/threonine-protein kinase RsbW
LAQLKVFLKLESDLKALDQVLGDFDQLNQPWIPRKDWLQCQLALAEGFTNAVRHAHKNLPRDIPIEIEINLEQDGLEIRIWDYGSPFDLNAFLANNHKNIDQFAGHGQGLPILKKIATHLSYLRTEDNRNCLLIVKPFSPLTPSELTDE